MAVVKKEHVLKLVIEKIAPYFTVYDGKSLLASNDEEAEPETAAEMLKDALESIESGIVTVKISDKTRKERGKGGSSREEYEFKINTAQQQGINGAHGSVNLNAIGYLEKIHELTRTIELQKRDNELKALADKFEELKKEKEAPDMLDKWMPLLQSFLSKEGAPLKTPVGLAGTDEPPIAEGATAAIEAQKKMRMALIRLAKVDKNLPETLTTLATFAEKKPAEYLGFIPVVKGMC